MAERKYHPSRRWQSWVYLVTAAELLAVVFAPYVPIQPRGACGPFELAYRAQPPTLDGRLEDWQGITPVIFTDGRVPAPERNRIVTFLAWDESALYAAFRVEDRFLNAIPKERLPEVDWIGSVPHLPLPQDSLQFLYLNDSVELFVTAQPEPAERFRRDDYEFVVDVLGRALAWQGSELLADWDPSLIAPKVINRTLAFEGVARRHGSLNFNEDVDEGFAVELAIPWASIGVRAPAAGQPLRLLATGNDNETPFPPAYDPTSSTSPHMPEMRYYSLDWCGSTDYLPSYTWAVASLVGGPAWFDRLARRYSLAHVLLFFATVTLVIGLLSALLVRRYARLRRRVLVVSPHEAVLPSADAVFLERAQKVAEAHLGDAHFTVEAFAAELGLSSRQLQRRLYALAGRTPAALLRSLRLQRAARLLDQHVGSVSEIAYAVGFKNPSHFARTFRTTFGQSPSEYQQRAGIAEEESA